MVMGRPREWDREKLKLQLIAWAELPNSLNLNAFCVLPEVMISPKKLLCFVDEDEDFRELYDIAKAMLAARREEAVTEKVLAECAYNRTIRYMDCFETTYWKREKQFESDLRKSEESNKPTEVTIRVKNDGLGAGINIST